MTESRTRAGSSTLTRLVTSFWLRRFCIPLPLGAADYSLPKGGNQGKTGQKEKWEKADKPGSVAPAGLTRWGRQPFLSTPGYPGALATYPQARPSRPYGALPHHAGLFGVAPDGGCLVSPLTLRPGLVSVALFVTSPCQGVTLHPALRSPDFPLCFHTAAAWPTPIAILSSKAESKSRQGGDHAQTPVFRIARCGQLEAHCGRPVARPCRGPSHALPLQARHGSGAAARGWLSRQDRRSPWRRGRADAGRPSRRAGRRAGGGLSTRGHESPAGRGADRHAGRRGVRVPGVQHGGGRGAELAAQAVRCRSRGRARIADGRRAAPPQRRDHRARGVAPSRGGASRRGDALRLPLAVRTRRPEVAAVLVERLVLHRP